MESEILYKSVNGREIGGGLIDYYVIPEHISELYSDLMCYGIKIQKTVMYAGGGKTVESRQINNVFYRYADAEDFLEAIAAKRAEPDALRDEVEKYITESIDRAGKSA